MNLKTWFKGLGVFVVSSFITSLAAANLSPSTFNFSRQGFSRLAVLATVIGVKAVLLYLKQSPLPGTLPTDWTKVSGAFLLALVLPAAGLISGCVNSWEQTTYATLATGKALVDCAVAGYNHADADIRQACAANPGDPAFDPSKFYIPQTRDAQQAIEKARQAQIACVEAFEGYAVAKLGKDKTVTLADKQAAVVNYVAQLPALFSAVRALLGTSARSDHREIGSPPQPAKTVRSGDPGSSGDRRTSETLEEAGQFGVLTLVRDLMPRSTTSHTNDFRPPDDPVIRWTDVQEVSLGQ